jgi:uncharacterized membrane protein
MIEERPLVLIVSVFSFYVVCFLLLFHVVWVVFIFEGLDMLAALECA